MHTQSVMRAGNGSATPPRTAADIATSHAAASAAARRDGTSSICLQDCPAERGELGIVGDIARDQIPHQVRIRQFEKFRECRTFVARGMRVSIP